MTDVLEELKDDDSPVTLNSRQAFLEAMPAERRFTTIYVENVGYVRIRSLNDEEYSSLQSYAVRSDGKINKTLAATFSSRLIVATVVDAEGNAFLKDADVAKLRQKDSRAVEQLAKAIRDWVGAPDEDEVKNV